MNIGGAEIVICFVMGVVMTIGIRIGKVVVVRVLGVVIVKEPRAE
jgi:hypothetical protein